MRRILLALLLALLVPAPAPAQGGMAVRVTLSDNAELPHPGFLRENALLQLSPSLYAAVGTQPPSFEASLSLLGGVPVADLAVWRQEQQLLLRTDLMPRLCASLDAQNVAAVLNAIGPCGSDASVPLPDPQPYADCILRWLKDIAVPAGESGFAVYGAPLGALYSALQAQAAQDRLSLDSYLAQFMPQEVTGGASPLAVLFSRLFTDGLLVSFSPDDPLAVAWTCDDAGAMDALSMTGTALLPGTSVTLALHYVSGLYLHLSLETQRQEGGFSLSVSVQEERAELSLWLSGQDGGQMTVRGSGPVSRGGNDVVSRWSAALDLLVTSGLPGAAGDEASSLTLRTGVTRRRWADGFAHDLSVSLDSGSLALYTLSAQAFSLEDAADGDTTGCLSVGGEELVRALPRLYAAAQERIDGVLAMLSAQEDR